MVSMQDPDLSEHSVPPLRQLFYSVLAFNYACLLTCKKYCSIYTTVYTCPFSTAVDTISAVSRDSVEGNWVMDERQRKTGRQTPVLNLTYCCLALKWAKNNLWLAFNVILSWFLKKKEERNSIHFHGLKVKRRVLEWISQFVFFIWIFVSFWPILLQTVLCMLPMTSCAKENSVPVRAITL